MDPMQPTEPSEILPGLWLGNAFTAANGDFFKGNHIKAVINCTPDVPNYFWNCGVSYLRVDVDDTLQDKDFEDMARQLPLAIQRITEQRDLLHKNVLVHCHRGMQRSAAVIVAYLYYFTGIGDLNDCIDFVKSKRSVAFFWGQQVNFMPSLLHLIGSQSDSSGNSFSK
jgi:dual specificity phosphatase 12